MSTVRMWCYGLLAPIENQDLFEDQLRRGHDYYNRLVEIEHKRRDARETLAGVPEEIREKPRRSWWPGRKPGSYRTAEEWKEVSRLLCEADQDQLAAIDKAAAAEARQARAESGCGWGTYQTIEASIRQAKSGMDEPRFHRWDGSGRVALHFQGSAPSGRGLGLDVADVLACDGRWLRIAPRPGPGNKRGHARGKAARTTARLRLGTGEHNEPIWVTFPMTMCRLLPPTSTIQWATVRRERIGPAIQRRERLPGESPAPPLRGDARYSLCLVVSMSEEDLQQETVEREGREERRAKREGKVRTPAVGRVAIDVGWRRNREGLRAGYWEDDAGKHGELLFPQVLIEKMKHVESLRSIRDRNFNTERAELLRVLELSDVDFPDWFRKDTCHAALWKAHRKLARLVNYWRRERFPGDELIFPRFDAWEQQDRHLWRWEANERDRTIARRNAIYANWAADFARTHTKVVVEDFNFKRFMWQKGTERIEAEDGTGEKTQADRTSAQRHLVAPGKLREYIEAAMQRRGREAVRRPMPFTTRECHFCGNREPWDQKNEVEHLCSACGKLWDQDRNACRNLLARDASADAVTDSRAPLAGEKPSENKSNGKEDKKRKQRGWSWKRNLSRAEAKSGEKTKENG